jgi:hypothetical protein
MLFSSIRASQAVPHWHCAAAIVGAKQRVAGWIEPAALYKTDPTPTLGL